MLTDFRPYLIKATYDWLCENEVKIFVKVNTLYCPVDVPPEHVDSEGSIVLNISMNVIGEIATQGTEYISFSIRFNQIERELNIHYNAIDAIYDPSSGQGNVFHRMENQEAPSKKEIKNADRRSKLRLVD